MLNEPLSNRYLADGKENFPLTSIQAAARDSIAMKLRNGSYPVEKINCPLCGGESSKCLSEKDTYGLPVKVVLCCDCGLVYNNPRLTPECLPAFYGENYRELDRVLPSVDAYFSLENNKGKRIHKFLADNNLLPRMQGKLVIDIGCGAGGVLGHFKEIGYEVLGCDFVPTHLEYGVAEKNLNLHYGSLEQIVKFVANKSTEIGLVIYEQVFEHLPDHQAELRKLHELLGPDSLLFIGVPGLRNIDEQYNSDFLRFLQLPHLVHFDLEHLVKMMRMHGFKFLAGNEIAQAVFVKSVPEKIESWPTCQETALFFHKLEQRRKHKERIFFVRNFPLNAGRYIKQSIEQSPLPGPVKNSAVIFLKKIKRLLKV